MTPEELADMYRDAVVTASRLSDVVPRKDVMPDVLAATWDRCMLQDGECDWVQVADAMRQQLAEEASR